MSRVIRPENELPLPGATEEDRRKVLDLIPEISLISSDQSRQRCTSIWASLWKAGPWPDLMAVPSLPDVPVSSVNNLVSHTRRVVRGCRALADALERPNAFDEKSMDEITEAAILHDVGKILEYEPGNDGASHRLSTLGRTMPHAATGAVWAFDAGATPRVSRSIYVHTPAVAASPDCLEAIILFAVDQCDADAARLGHGLLPFTKHHFSGQI